ncbi:unnamed protein product [Enterobius vermicularis]|uniref:Ras-GEF domain-containing protein n=1 Tax=Enterobius vermicularis TaxID=51028 RepID=A0A0N4VDR4_ENTVE|nr:unnamed protein product [Enterobius vermicularis]
MSGPSCSETTSLRSLRAQKFEQWRAQELFVERIYRVCNHVHPGIGVEHEAVQLIQDLLMRILYEILEARPQKVEDMERCMRNSIPESMCRWITQEYETNDLFSIITARRLYERRSSNAKNVVSVFHTLQAKFKEHYGYHVDDKVVLYALSIIDYIIADILKWTGNYIKNIRKKTLTIGLDDLKVALGADLNLIELSEMLINDGDSVFLGMPCHCQVESIKAKDWTYKGVALTFKHEEEQYLEVLDMITNVFRQRFETALGTSGKHYLEDVFGNVVEIYELTLKVQRLLEDAIEMSDTPCVGAGIWELCEAQEFDVYVTYMNLFERGEDREASMVRALKNLLSDSAYKTFFEVEDRKYSISPGGKTFTLMVNYVLPSLLQIPVLHFFRYVKYTATLSCLIEVAEEKEDLRCALTYFNHNGMRIESLCTPELKTRLRNDQPNGISPSSNNKDDFRRILEIQRSIEAWEGDAIGYSCTSVVREGDLMMIRSQSATVSLIVDTLKKARNVTDRHVFLFDQLLVFCKFHRSARPDKPLYKFKGSVMIRKTEIFDVDDTEEFQNAFRIQIRHSQDSMEAWTLLCRTSEEKTSWLTDLVTIQTKSILNRMLSSSQEEERKRYPLILPSLKQYRFAEPDTDDNIVFEDYTSSSGIPVVKHATVLKLVERLTYHLYTDNNFVRTFLTTYRSFCSPLDLLQLLIERFKVPTPYQLSAVERNGSNSPPWFYDTNYAKNGAYATIHAQGFPGQVTVVPWNRVEKSYHLFRKDYLRPIQLSVLRVIRQWVNQHWYDFENDPLLLANLTFFLKETDHQANVKNSYKDWCRNIQTFQSCIARKTRHETLSQNRSTTSEGAINQVEEQSPSSSPRLFLPCTPPVLWHTAKKGEVATYDLLSLHPLEIGRQLTLVEFDLYRAIKPIELVGSAWTKRDKDRRSPQLLRLIEHSTMLTYWVARSIVETPSLEERVEMFSRVLEIMMVFEELNNFTGLVALYSALNSCSVYRLRATWERLDREKQSAYEKFKKLCNPHWKEMIERLRSINPPCVPFFGHYLSKIFFYEEGNSTFVQNHDVDLTHEQVGKENLPISACVNKKILVSFVKCRRVAAIISDIQMYQNQPYAFEVEPSIRSSNNGNVYNFTEENRKRVTE